MTSLAGQWDALVGASPAAREIGDGLLRRWNEPHRAYHTVDHLREVLEAIDVLADHASDVVAVRLAAWFHDAVYDGVPDEDEEASAQLALDALASLSWPAATIDEVARLVRLTATHNPDPGDANGEVLCDADLAILGSESKRYAAYRANVRAEYSHVTEPAFRAGRAAVLTHLLALDPLYRTPTARERWSAAARRNLTAELAELSAS